MSKEKSFLGMIDWKSLFEQNILPKNKNILFLKAEASRKNATSYFYVHEQHHLRLCLLHVYDFSDQIILDFRTQRVCNETLAQIKKVMDEVVFHIKNHSEIRLLLLTGEKTIYIKHNELFQSNDEL